MQGRLDSPLTARGRMQADVHGVTIKSLGGAETMIVSPLGRTRQTADIVNDHLRVPRRYEAALMERDCGVWSGMTAEEIAVSYPDGWQARSRHPYFHRPPGGESLQDMRARVSGFLGDLMGRSESRLVLVTHGIMSRVIIGHFQELTPEATVTVRHPNELFYRLEIGRDSISASHFLSGEGPVRGLLRYGD